MADGTRGWKSVSVPLRWVARALFAAGILWLLSAWWNGRRPETAPSAAPGVPSTPNWLKTPWSTWKNALYGISLERPADWQADEPFERFTQREMGDLQYAPVAGFRGDTPIVVYRYTAPVALIWNDWKRRFKNDVAFRNEFGSAILAERPTEVSGQPALDILAQGATARRLWRYHSLFFTRGRLAFRVTAGADHQQWPAIQPTFDRILKSVTCVPPPSTSNSTSTSNSVPTR